MFTYKTTEFTTHSEALEALRSDISLFTFPDSIVHKVFGAGKLKAIEVPPSAPTLYLTIDFNGSVKRLACNVCMASNMLSGPEAYMESLTEYQNSVQELYGALEAIRKAEAAEARQKQQLELEAKKQAEADKKRHEAMEAKLKKLAPVALSRDPVTYYEIIGWLAKNIGTISASLNSDYESWFVKNFGNVKHGIIDSKAKTKNGDPMKYSISFKASLKTEAPASISRLNGVKKRSIDSVEYIWDLVQNYGFKFGKQDPDNIRKYIPAEYMAEFEAGFACA